MRSGFGYAEPHRMGLHKYDARCCIIFMERYRSGHNGADSKSVCAQAHEGSNPSLSAKKKNHPIGWFFFFINAERGGFERSEQNNLNGCFVNGDRRFLHDVTKDNIRNVGQKSRTNPFLIYSQKGLRDSLFCCIINSPINKNL